MKPPAEAPGTLDDLRELLARLRGPTGCPWDRKQTPETLKTYLLEETYELAEALDRQSPTEIQEELGDLLFILIFISRVYEEQGAFDLDQVIERIYRKMVRRHPHVFGDSKWQDAGEVVKGWQTIKAEENPQKTPFDSIPAALPSLLKAHRLSQRAAGLGFEWPDLPAILQKVHEELGEMEEAFGQDDPESVAEELGDLLFVLVNVGRMIGISAENALRKSNRKFLNRFLTMLDEIKERGLDPETLSPQEWLDFWTRSKKTTP